jgi:hypothetical protein
VKARAACLRLHLSPYKIGNLGDEGVGVNSVSHIYMMVLDVRYYRVKNFLRTPNFIVNQTLN